MIAAMLTDLRRERRIRQALRGLARQRVVMILQPGNVPVIEKATNGRIPDLEAVLLTAQMRGWVEVMHHAVPHASLGSDFQLPKEWESQEHIYRLTDAGWAAIYRTQGWVVATFIVSLAALIAALVQIAVSK